MSLPKRKNTRLLKYDYSNTGAYFITICTHNKQFLLGNINNEIMELSVMGKICKNEIEQLENKFNIKIENHVIMPNHVHFLIILYNNDKIINNNSIIEIVRRFKSITTKNANKLSQIKENKLWQRSFHDHIIRNEKIFLFVRDYIENNVQSWYKDKFYM